MHTDERHVRLIEIPCCEDDGSVHNIAGLGRLHRRHLRALARGGSRWHRVDRRNPQPVARTTEIARRNNVSLILRGDRVDVAEQSFQSVSRTRLVAPGGCWPASWSPFGSRARLVALGRRGSLARMLECSWQRYFGEFTQTHIKR